MKKTIIILMTLFLAACSGASSTFGSTPLEKYLKARGYGIPNVIDYDDFYNAALDEGMVDIDKVLADNNIQVLGSGDSRYIRATELLDACGKDCSYHEGWGIFLSKFAEQTHRGK